jgi:hypothetical protein
VWLIRLFLGDTGGPAIGGGDRRIELAMRVIEPDRPLIIEIGQGALPQDRRRPVIDRQDAVRKPNSGASSGTLRTRSLGFSHASRSSFKRRPASAIATARGSSAYSAAGIFGVSPAGKGKGGVVLEP